MAAAGGRGFWGQQPARTSGSTPRLGAVEPLETGAIPVTLSVRLTNHFLRRLEERGGDLGRLLVEGGVVEAQGWLRAVHDHDYNLVVPGFGQIRIRVDPLRGAGFVAVTFLPLTGS